MPTPRHEGFDAGGHRGRPDSLHAHVKQQLWPTPLANDDNKSVDAHLQMKARMKGGARSSITSLQVAVKDATSPEPRQFLLMPRHEGLDAGGPATLEAQGQKLHPAFVARLMGFPDHWLDPEVSHANPWQADHWAGDPRQAFGHGHEYGVPLTHAHRIPQRIDRLKALGNAIVPQVAHEIFLAINAAEEQG